MANPLRVVALAQVMEPGVLVDTFRELQELNEVARTQIQLLLRSPEEEAAVGRQLTLRVLARVAAALGVARRDFQAHRRRATLHDATASA